MVRTCFLACKWLSSSCVFMWWKHVRELSMISFIRTLISFMRVYPHDLITSQRPPLLSPNTVTLGTRFQHTNLGEHKYSIYHAIIYYLFTYSLSIPPSTVSTTWKQGHCLISSYQQLKQLGIKLTITKNLLHHWCRRMDEFWLCKLKSFSIFASVYLLPWCRCKVLHYLSGTQRTRLR